MPLETEVIKELRGEIEVLREELRELKGKLDRILEILDENLFDLEVRKRLELLEKGKEEIVGEEEIMRALE